MDLELVKLLKQTGFTQKEAMVYLALLETSQADVTDISKISGLKRSTIYVLLEGLIEKGYVSQVKDKKVNTYQPLDPAVIHSQLQSTSKTFGQMLPFLQSMRNKGKKKPRIHYIDTKEGIWNVFEEMSHTPKAMFVSSYERVEQFFPGAVDKWVKDFKKGVYKLKGKNLVPNNPVEIKCAKKFLAADQEVRVLPEAEKITMDFALYGNKLAITLFEEEAFMVVIESEELVKSMQPIFEIAWEKGKPVK